jgi:O-antigen biosynthesis protein
MISLRPRKEEPAAVGFEPIAMVEVEVGEALRELAPGPTPAGDPYPLALASVRLHGAPVGLVHLRLDDGTLTAGALAAALWPEIDEAVNRHLAEDGLPAAAALTPAGLVCADRPRCQVERDRFLLDPPALTVLIPSRERPERLRRCLESILACEYPDGRLSVLVVDNAPATDATLRLVEELAATGAPISYAREDAPGSASARNRGLALIETELVAMTDDDTIVDPYWPCEVARAFAANPEAGCVTGLLVPAELDSPPQVWFEQYGGFTRGFAPRRFDLGDNRPAEPLFPWTAGAFGTGNNFSFRAASLREIGGFDPALGNGTPALGGVDSEALLRTVLSGQTIVYEPRAVVHHAHRPDYADLRRQVYSYGVGLTAYYLKTLLARPALIGDFLAKIPVGLRFLLSADSGLNEAKLEDYPAELEWLERRGMLVGPWAYAKSRRRYGPHRVPLPAAEASRRKAVAPPR